jgi:hypothetical protein
MQSTIKFNKGRKKYEWTVETNIDKYGLKVEDAFENWSTRFHTLHFSIEDFCAYVVSKNVTIFRCTPVQKNN